MPSTKIMAAALRLARKTGWIAVLIAALGIAVDLALMHFFTDKHRTQQENGVTLELAALRARIEGQLNNDLYLVFGMAAHIAVDTDISANRFDRLSRELESKSPSLRHIAVAPDFIIRYVYPLKGNASVLGMNYRSVPDQWQAALAVKESGHPILAGPLNLVQGGYDLVVRVPVILTDTGAFWGLVSAVIDFEGLLRTVGLEPASRTLQVAIRGKDGRGEKGEIFWGGKSLFEKKTRAVTMMVVLASGMGTWQIAAIPTSGWIVVTPYRWTIHLSVLAIAVLALLTTIARYHGKRKLIESEKRLKSMSQASHDALIMIDDNSRITFWNPAAEAMFGYTEAEAWGRICIRCWRSRKMPGRPESACGILPKPEWDRWSAVLRKWWRSAKQERFFPSSVPWRHFNWKDDGMLSAACAISPPARRPSRNSRASPPRIP